MQVFANCYCAIQFCDMLVDAALFRLCWRMINEMSPKKKSSVATSNSKGEHITIQMTPAQVLIQQAAKNIPSDPSKPPNDHRAPSSTANNTPDVTPLSVIRSISSSTDSCVVSTRPPSPPVAAAD